MKPARSSSARSAHAYLAVTLIFCLAVLAGLSPTAAYAQDGTITGTVTESQAGDPLDGVSIILGGTRRDATTGDDGTYSMSSSVKASTGTGVSIAVRVAREPKTTTESPNAASELESSKSSVTVSPPTTVTDCSTVA